MMLQPGMSLNEVRPSGSVRQSRSFTNIVISKLSPTSRRRFSNTPRIQLSAFSTSVNVTEEEAEDSSTDLCMNIDIGPRSMSYFDRLASIGEEMGSGNWRNPAKLSDFDPGLLHDLQCVARRIVLERKLEQGGFILGRGEDDLMPSSASADAASQVGRSSRVGQGRSSYDARSLGGDTRSIGRGADTRSLSGVTPSPNKERGQSDQGEQDENENPVVEPNEKKWFSLCVAQYVGEMEKMLDNEDINVDRRDYFSGFTAIHWAAKLGNKDMLRVCLRHKPNVNIKAGSGDTALHLASKHNHPFICTILLEHGASTNLRDNTGKLPCEVCSKKITPDVLEKLSKGANTKEAMTEKSSALKKPSAMAANINNLRVGPSKSRGSMDEDGLNSPTPSHRPSSWFKRSTKPKTPKMSNRARSPRRGSVSLSTAGTYLGGLGGK